MNGSLAGIVGRVRQSAEEVTTASTQIAAGNTDLSTRTEEQASSLEETAASIEEMTATVNQNAQNANEANKVASTAADVARRGGEAVDEVVKMMENIQASSRKIGDIIGVIDSIAFQTNILALNAAVEAARAGDQGRGFAVVAGEVRSLAQRSAEAAKEIKTLITDSVGRVDDGARLADDAGKTMVEVVSSVNRVSQIIGEIAAATQEQSTGIAQVNTAVGDLDKVTQQNASLVEESTAASESLQQLAREMVTAVSVFRLSSSAPAKPTLAAPPAPRGPAVGAGAPSPGEAGPARESLAAARPRSRNGRSSEMSALSRNDSQVARDEFLAFRLGDEEYAIDILKVQEIRAHEAVDPHRQRARVPEGRDQPARLHRPDRGPAREAGDGAPRPTASAVAIILNLDGPRDGNGRGRGVRRRGAGRRTRSSPRPEFGAVVDARFISGIATMGERMMILVDITRLMTSGELAVVERAAA
jgi:hypothetical protein